LSENLTMQKFLFTLVLCSASATVLAQPEANVLGLPAVPQIKAPSEVAPSATPGTPSAGKPGAKPSANPGASAPKAGASAPVNQATNDSALKSVLSGGVTMASSYNSTTTTVRVTTANTYPGAVLAAQAIQAARLVQRDLKLSCGKLCKPAPMAAPQILKDGTLQFDMVIDGYQGQLSNEDMLSMMMAKPLPVPAAPKPVAPVPPPAAAAAKPTAPAAAADTATTPTKAP
jgi:hypothetical protein